MPPATVTPALLMEPPLAFTPLTVGNSLEVSYSQMTLPSRAEMACMRPSQVPAKRTPGIAVIAAACEGLHEFRFSPGGGGTDQLVFPFAISDAETQPVASRLFASKLCFAAHSVSP